MKHTDIKTDGTVYWYEASSQWGQTISPDYNRGPVRRVDDLRYSASPRWSSHRAYREDPRGTYIRVVRVVDDQQGDRKFASELYVPTAHVRDAYEAVKTQYEQQQAAQQDKRERQRVANDDARRYAETLMDRAACADLDARVNFYPADYRTPSPQIKVTMTADALAALLDRLGH